MNIGFFQGTFDIVNAGHVRALALAKAKCDVLVIGLNTDDIVKIERNREAIIPYLQRKEILESIRSVDLVIPADEIYALPFIKALGATLFVTVEEWLDRQNEAVQYMETIGGEVLIPPYFPKDGVTLSSTDIRNRIKGLS